MAEVSTGQAIKESVRTASVGLGDRMKVVSAKTRNHSNKDLDIALVKATTSRFHVVPKEKHVSTLKMAVAHGQGTAHYVAVGLLKRLHEATDWLTALKSLVVFHRLFRETEGPVFLGEVARLGEGQRGRGGHALAVDNFLDASSGEGRFDFSEWVRAYGKYLDEQVAVFAATGWRPELEAAGAASPLRGLPAPALLEQLPALQRLQRRLVDCVPRGGAARDDVALLALSLVVRESFTLYKAISEGVINLADAFFRLEFAEAAAALESYKEAIAGGEALSKYYSDLQAVDAVKRSMELPHIAAPPADFVDSMEAYLKDAPRPAPADGAAPAPPRNVAPLRKGRLMQALPRPGSAGSQGAALRDPGMLLPAGSLPAPDTPEDSSPSEAESAAAAAAAEAEEQAAAEAPPPPPPPLPDLLDFGDLSLGEAPAVAEFSAEFSADPAAAAAVEPAPKAAPSALDLLAELDFGAPPQGGGGTGPPGAPPPASQNPFAAQQAAPQQYGGQRDVSLFKSAGAHDPFAALPGLPPTPAAQAGPTHSPAWP